MVIIVLFEFTAPVLAALTGPLGMMIGSGSLVAGGGLCAVCVIACTADPAKQ